MGDWFQLLLWINVTRLLNRIELRYFDCLRAAIANRLGRQVIGRTLLQQKLGGAEPCFRDGSDA